MKNTIIFLCAILLCILSPLPASAQTGDIVDPVETQNFASLRDSVIFTQIKTSGETPNDEFIELFNTTNEEIPLLGLSILKETASGRQYTIHIFETETISPLSFFLLAHQDGLFADDADQLYSKSLADNNKLILIDSENIILDEISWGDEVLISNPASDETLMRVWDKETQSFALFQIEPFADARDSLTIWPQDDPPEDPPAEEAVPTVIISELSINPLENDDQWIELYNSDAEVIDLSTWYLSNALEVEFNLSGLIQPDQFLIFFFEETWINLSDTITLLNDTQDIVDEWQFDLNTEPGQSLIVDSTQLELTDHPTAGRPNILFRQEPLVCEEIIVQPPPEEEVSNEPALQTGSIALSEIFANPESDEGENEFVELFNNETTPINLDQWTIADASKSFTLSDLSIPAQSFLVLPRSLTSIALNNGSETVTLTDPFGVEIASHSYASTTEGLSYNYQPVDLWYEAQPSPGTSNTPQPAPEPAPVVEVEPAPSSPQPTPQAMPTQTEEEISPDNQQVQALVSDPNLKSIILNELIPNPEGSDEQEWIELFNPTESTIKLSGLTVSDPAWDYLFTEGEIKPDGMFVLKREQSKIALNNTGDIIKLVIDDNVFDEFTYSESKEGYSWARKDDDEWLMTQEPTPNEVNQFPIEEEVKTAAEKTTQAAKKTTSSAKTTKAKPAPKQIGFEEWLSIQDDENVTLTGVVTVTPGTFNNRTVIIQNPNTDSPQALEIYFHKAEWPNLVENDMITVTGEKSVTTKGDRLLVRDKNDIIVSDGTGFDPFHLSSIENMNDSLQLALIEASSTLIEQNKNTLLIDFDGQEFNVSLKAASIELEDLEDRSQIQLTGILKKKGDAWEIWPRKSDDILVNNPLEIVDAAIASEAIPQPDMPASGKNWGFLLWLILGSALSTAIVLFVLHKDVIIKQVKEKLTLIRNKIILWIRPTQTTPNNKS